MSLSTSEMITDIDIITLIPQRAPFVMVDAITGCNDSVATTTFHILPENLLVADGRFTEPGLIENIAQTAAARIGYICQLENRPVPVGYIAAVQRLVIHALPLVQDRLMTEVVVKNQVLHVTIVEGIVRVNEKVIASCEMKIFIAQ